MNVGPLLEAAEKKAVWKRPGLWLVAAFACCTSAGILVQFNARNVRANPLPLAGEALLSAPDEGDARGAARCVADHSIDAIKLLLERAKRDDLVGQHCRDYLRGIAKLAASSPPVAPAPANGAGK